MAEINHPNIVKVIDLKFIPFPASRNKTIYLPAIVLELIDGVNLSSYEFKDKFECLDIIKQISDTITFLQSKDLYYKDLKPSNLMITKINGESLIKFVDFGAIKGKIRKYREAKTATLSTKFYADPQTNNSNALDLCDIRSTVHQLGALSYQFLGGDMKNGPFTKGLDCKNEEQSYHVNESQSLIKIPDMSDEVYSVLSKATAYDLSERYQSATEFMNALTEALLNP